MQHRQFHPALWQKVEQQATLVPEIYGGIDFSRPPERFTTVPSGDGLEGFEGMIPEIMADKSLVEMMAAYTLTGDPVADAYAARIPEHGFRQIVDWLETACDKGIEAVPEAPVELAAFLAAMEARPKWLDMKLVREGARIERNHYAHLVPFAIRGAFLATFMNKYSALPMALTGQLSDQLAAKRVHETATFFTLTVMPGALDRKGAAFKAAAMVRLMHSMVRFNVMKRQGLWETGVYGVPIPQVDQMPAGQIGSFLIAFRALKEGREQFTDEERARIEIGRYRCFLLGLPEPLLGDTPKSVARLMLARQATLRGAFDEATCGALVRGTMNTELSFDNSLTGKIDRELERSFSKAFFIKHFLQGDTRRANQMGVTYTLKDRKLALIAATRIFSQLRLFGLLGDIPVIREIADRILVGKLDGLLKRYGHARFETDANTYRPTI
ncbi:oxygenase MpaB family protein [Asticcacaulis sp.]|uniref:oxygenase MpaB family protein n=1 Tax=Asticcacaulis sp. TaxID=1872648 RepID=UPI003F7CC402